MDVISRPSGFSLSPFSSAMLRSEEYLLSSKASTREREREMISMAGVGKLYFGGV